MNQDKIEVFMNMALEISKLSPDAETKVGSIAVHPDTYDCILPSYNGFVAGGPDDLPDTRPAKYEYIIHSEVNMICQAARTGRSLEGYWSIQTLSPCSNCTRTLWQSGIRTIIFKDEYRDFKNQSNMKDIDMKITHIGKYTKLELFSR